MPRVPTYDSFQATPTAQPNTPLRTPEFQDFAGAQAQQTSRAVMQTANVAGRIAVDLQEQANQLRVDDALNKAKEAALKLTFDKDIGFSNVRGESALNRPSGKPLADEYSDNLRDQISKINDGLGNDAQKQSFSLRANDLVANFRGSAIKHETDQFRDYALSVREGTIANQMQTIGLMYDNPDEINKAVASIKAATYDQSRLLGKSAEWAEAQSRKMISNAHKVALSAALENNNVAYAEQYLKKYSKDMDADDILRVQGVITKEIDTRAAIGTASEVMQRVAPKVVTGDFDRAFNILLKTESGGRQFDSAGKPLTSSAGAIGIAQVMPGTGPEAAKLAGLKWDAEKYRNDATYNAALGRAYFQEQIKTFGGDIAKAWAAYNAGPGATQKAIKAAETKGGEWLAYLPKETQDYVTKNLNAYAAGDGKFERPTLQDVHNEVRQRLGTTSPARLKLAIDEATRQFSDMEKAIKQREDETVANAMRAITQNGGRFSELPIGLRAALPPKEVDNLMSFANRIAKGDDITNMALYQKLATDENKLRSMSDNEFYRLRSQLSESDFKHFANQRNALINAKKTAPQEQLNSNAINSVLNDRLRMLGMDPSPKDGSDEAMQIGVIRKTVRDQILSQQSVAGKQFTDAEVEKAIDGLIAKSQTFRTSFLGISTGTTAQRLLTMSAGDIPAGVRDRLRADFKAAGVPNPTNADILGAYWELKFKQK